jgi:hypothetical protein
MPTSLTPEPGAAAELPDPRTLDTGRGVPPPDADLREVPIKPTSENNARERLV